MDNLKRLKKQSIRATDVAAQYWCERQMEYGYLFGERITKEIKKGKEIHKEMEEETNVPVVLMSRTYDDYMYKVIYTSVVALETLFKGKKSREIMLYGMLNGFPFVGKMDMLEIKDSETQVWEDKTKSNDNLPSDPQLLTHKIQVMLYKRMLDEIKGGRYNLEMFRKFFRTQSLKISMEFARQLDALSIEKALQSVDAVAVKYFELMMKLPKISEDLHIRYINQLTGKEIKLYRFKYDEKEIGDALEFVLKYWRGERDSLPVPEDEKWKCNYCAFFGKECKVWWPQKKL